MCPSCLDLFWCMEMCLNCQISMYIVLHFYICLLTFWFPIPSLYLEMCTHNVWIYMYVLEPHGLYPRALLPSGYLSGSAFQKFWISRILFVLRQSFDVNFEEKENIFSMTIFARKHIHSLQKKRCHLWIAYEFFSFFEFRFDKAKWKIAFPKRFLFLTWEMIYQGKRMGYLKGSFKVVCCLLSSSLCQNRKLCKCVFCLFSFDGSSDTLKYAYMYVHICTFFVHKHLDQKSKLAWYLFKN